MRYISEKDFICTYHKYIIDSAKKLLKTCENDIEKDLIEEILICAKYALKSGKRMEKRLYAYRNSIEALGYKRNKRKRK